jgi:hypothetical protein
LKVRASGSRLSSGTRASSSVIAACQAAVTALPVIVSAVEPGVPCSTRETIHLSAVGVARSQ